MNRKNQSVPADARVRVESLHEAHPEIRARDWRSPLVARLTDEKPYADGEAPVVTSFKSRRAAPKRDTMVLAWSELEDDYKQCLHTYQSPVISEFAALALACVLCHHKAGLEITEVTRRGEKVDYWLGRREAEKRELLLEVSGTKDGNLDELCQQKATDQLTKNPFQKDGYVCASRFSDPEARLWFYPFPKPKKSSKTKKPKR